MKKFSKAVRTEYVYALVNAVLIGIIVGVVVCFFNKALSFLSKTSVSIYEYVRNNAIFIPLFFLGLVLIALLMAYIHKKNPQVRGGGMPQTIAMCKGEIKYKWYQVLWANISCSFLSFFSGLPVGAEGPSMFVGAASADGVWKHTKSRPYFRKYLISAGASSGFAATFNAPLAGILFTVEKVHRKFSPLLLFVVGIAVIFSTLTINLISLLWGGTSPFFDFGALTNIPFKFYWVLLLLGIAVGFAAYLFQLLLVKTQKYSDKKTKEFPFWARLIFAFIFTGALGLFFLDAITGGHNLIEKVVKLDFSLQSILVLLLIKLFLITICYNSGATGGLFIPSLCVGALVGGLCGHLFILVGMPVELYSSVVCFAMLGFLTGTTHAPMSSLVLMLEITGFSGNLLSSGIVIIVAFVVSLVFRRKSLYEEQVERLVEKSGFNENRKAITKTVKLKPNSILINKRVSDVFLPQSMDVCQIVRNGKIIVSDAETRFLEADEVLFIYQANNKKEVHKYLKDIST